MLLESTKIEVEPSAVKKGVRLCISGEKTNEDLVRQLNGLEGWCSVAYVKAGQAYDKKGREIIAPDSGLVFVAHAEVVTQALGILQTSGLIDEKTETAAAAKANQIQESVDSRAAAKESQPRARRESFLVR